MITINGDQKTGYDGITLENMIREEGFQKERIAVEINGVIAGKKKYGEIVLKSGDVVEVVSFVGGG